MAGCRHSLTLLSTVLAEPSLHIDVSASPTSCFLPAALCRPAPEGTGWSYSTQMIELVREYKARFPSVLAALEPSAADGSLEGGDQRQKLTAAALFPGAPPELLDQKLAEVWGLMICNGLDSACWCARCPTGGQCLVDGPLMHQASCQTIGACLKA